MEPPPAEPILIGTTLGATHVGAVSQDTPD